MQKFVGGTAISAGVPAGAVLWRKYGSKEKTAQAWKRKLLAGEIKREAKKILPLIKRMQEKILPGLERGNQRLLEGLKTRGWKIKVGPGKDRFSSDIYTDSGLMEIRVPKSFFARNRGKRQRLIEGVFLRHEIDEARAAERIFKKEFGMPLSKMTPKQRLAGSFAVSRKYNFMGYHHSPEILRQESILVSQMPDIRSHMQMVRSGDVAKSFEEVGQYGKYTPVGKKQIKAWLRSIGWAKRAEFEKTSDQLSHFRRFGREMNLFLGSLRKRKAGTDVFGRAKMRRLHRIYFPQFKS